MADIESKQTTTAEKLPDGRIKTILTREDIFDDAKAKQIINDLKKQQDDINAEVKRMEEEIDMVKDGWLPSLKKLEADLQKIGRLNNLENLKFTIKDKKERLQRITESLEAFAKVGYQAEIFGVE